MKKALFRDTVREIVRTKNRFISIFLIVALGVGFFAGVKATCPDMQDTADDYFINQNLMDIRLVSTFGFSDNDLAAIQGYEGVRGIMPSYSVDTLINLSGRESVVRVHALPAMDVDSQSSSAINRPQLLEGRMPEKPGECLIEGSKQQSEELQLGKTVTLRSGKTEDDIFDTLTEDTYTIVGIVRSPMYITFLRGNSSIGNGSVSYFMMIPKENFDMEAYTEVYVTLENTKGISAFGEQYDETIEKAKDDFEIIASQREQGRFDEIFAEANEKIEDAKKELQEGMDTQKRELGDASKKLSDARQELLDGEQELIEKEAELADKLKEAEDKFKEAEEKFADAQKQIDEGSKEYSFNYKLYREARLEAGEKLAKAKEELAAATALLNQKEAAYKTQAEGVAQLKDGLVQALEPLTQSPIAALEMLAKAALAVLDDPTAFPQDEKDAIVAQLVGVSQDLSDNMASYLVYEAALREGRKQLDAGWQEVALGNSRIEGAYEDFDNARYALREAKNKLDNAKAKYDEEYATYLKEKQDALDKIEEGRQKIEDAKIEIADGKIELADAQKEYDDAKRDSDKEIADAQEKIADAQADLSKLELPVWYVFDRDNNTGYAEYGQNAERIDAIAKIFPVFFILVAALVSLTTMTRMVEEQRTQIGTIKALGYSRWDIVSKYLIYAMVASFCGSVFGLIVGMQLFPQVIYNAYLIITQMPPLIAPFRWDYALWCTVIAVFCTTMSALFACYKEMSAQPAELMRPKAPKAGKRVLLERIGFLWSRISFSHKVTIRNLLRYKKRFFMTVVGIAGCTALLLTGFGIRDSITDIASIQYNELYQYKLIAYLNDEISSQEMTAFLDAAKGYEEIEESLLVREKPLDAQTPDGIVSTNIFVVPNGADISQYIDLRTREDKSPLTLDDNGVIVTEKIAKLMGVSKGDTFQLIDGDNIPRTFTVGAIIEHYVFHNVYMTEATYQQVFKEKPIYNVLLGKTAQMDTEREEEISSALLEYDNVLNVSFTTSVLDNFDEMIGSLQYVVLVLIISAGALAFIVLYNLTNINVNERIREIATIKVLGFYDREVSAYIYRENGILAFIGMLVGLVGGIFLHRFVIQTAEVNTLMFGRDIGWLSFVLAGLLTMLFTALVNFVLYFRLKKISMVESLKSVE